MPHVVVRLWPGKTQAQKRDLTDTIVREVTSVLNYGSDAVSVGFEEVSSPDWDRWVFARPPVEHPLDRGALLECSPNTMRGLVVR